MSFVDHHSVVTAIALAAIGIAGGALVFWRLTR